MKNIILLIFSLLFYSSDRKTDSVFGVFTGRTPCREVSDLLNLGMDPDCSKLKWKLTLYQDALTREPTTYRLDATFSRQKPRTGTWKVMKGIASDPEAIIYQLDFQGSDRPVDLYVADNNVLFFTDGKELLHGNADNSYTLNKTNPKE